MGEIKRINFFSLLTAPIKKSVKITMKLVNFMGFCYNVYKYQFINIMDSLWLLKVKQTR